ncbi:hypothetical protein [Gemmata obscuriglobus]|uniref:hypothetical protein n=1 Tax=Gemmata obscuriglobus TaxID=114 RepID=UPI001E3E5EA7|nr:hypothetical protein [Gemmata obscuriglobus]
MDHDGSRALVELVEQLLEGQVSSTELECTCRAHARWCAEATPEWDWLNYADEAVLEAATLYWAPFECRTAQLAARGIVQARMGPVNLAFAKSCESLPMPEHDGTPSDSVILVEFIRQYDAAQSLVEKTEADYLAQEQAEQVVLLRDIFGNPFRPVTFSLEWRTETTVALAAQMYESRDFSVMPILADALQDAGCDSADILDHCRGSGPHVRGCWVVDLVLGKQ